MARPYMDEWVPMARRRAGNPDTSEITDAEILRIFNTAINTLASKYNMPDLGDDETITTVSGTQEYAFPAGTLKIENGRNSTIGGIIRQIGTTRFTLFMEGSGSHAGNPEWFTISRSSDAGIPYVQLYPIPIAAHSLVFPVIKKHPDLVLSPTANCLIVNEAWDSIVFDHAVIEILIALQNYDGASSYMKMTEALNSNASLEQRERWANEGTRERNWIRGKIRSRFWRMG